MTKERIEELYGLQVIALVGTNKYLTIDKEEKIFEDVNGHNCVKTIIYYGCVNVVDNNFGNYECTSVSEYDYDMVTQEITKRR